MNFIVNGREMQKIDEYTINTIGMPQLVLMERAALGVFDFICGRFPETNHRALIVVESGNNGADGVAVARLLKNKGYEASIYWINKIKVKSEAFDKQLNIARLAGVKIIDNIDADILCGYDIFVDGIFGVGLNRDIKGYHEDVINLINDAKGFKIAIDIPSGIDATTGEIHNCAFKADATVTFGAQKLGILTGQGQEYSGEIKLVDIGILKQAYEAIKPSLYSYDLDDIDNLLPVRRADSHKGSYGRVAIIGGNVNMAGAVLFSAEAAYRMGVGLVKIYTVKANREIVQTKLPEALVHLFDTEDKQSIITAAEDAMKWADVIVIGPGLGVGTHSEILLRKIVPEYNKKIIIDADGLNTISTFAEIFNNTSANIVITPHLMEMSRLTRISVADIKCDKYEVAKQFARKYNITVVLKDARTIVSDGSWTAYINLSGCNGMATGGSGDVLSGIIGALCAQGLDDFEAAKLGVYIHGLCGERTSCEMGNYSMLAGDIVRSITKVMEAEYNA